MRRIQVALTIIGIYVAASISGPQAAPPVAGYVGDNELTIVARWERTS